MKIGVLIKTAIVAGIFSSLCLADLAQAKNGPFYGSKNSYCDVFFGPDDVSKTFVDLYLSTIHLPDIATYGPSPVERDIGWVGMENLRVPVTYPGLEGTLRTDTASIDTFVNLSDASAKGIHMSRLFLLSEQIGEDYQKGVFEKDLVLKMLGKAVAGHAEDLVVEGINAEHSGNILTWDNLDKTVKEMLASHRKPGNVIADSARLKVTFLAQRVQDSLVSNNEGLRSYPVTLEAKIVEGKPIYSIQIGVEYSSTCPCSAALSRQVVAQKILDQFSGEMNPSMPEIVKALQSAAIGSSATPHAQRSMAVVRLAFTNLENVPNFLEVGRALDKVVGAPTQSAVKREDEQAFAVENGQNLGFVEDKMRQIAEAIENGGVTGGVSPEAWHVKLSHYESLHSHDAVAEDFGGDKSLLGVEMGSLALTNHF